MTTDPKTIAYLLSLANDMREAHGDAPLTDIPKSIPTLPRHCVIANAFNYDCVVMPESANGLPGFIYFKTRKDARAYCKVTGVRPCEIGDTGFLDRRWHVPLTEELNRIAWLFDEGKIFTEYVMNSDEQREYYEDE